MIFYFPITESEFKKCGLVAQMVKGDPFPFNLTGDNLYMFTMSDSAGSIVDYMHKYRTNDDVGVPYAICKAIVDDKLAIEAIRAALVGDVVKNLPVHIIEVTWIK